MADDRTAAVLPREAREAIVNKWRRGTWIYVYVSQLAASDEANAALLAAFAGRVEDAAHLGQRRICNRFCNQLDEVHDMACDALGSVLAEARRLRGGA
jgi:hypothetical protein